MPTRWILALATAAATLAPAAAPRSAATIVCHATLRVGVKPSGGAATRTTTRVRVRR